MDQTGKPDHRVNSLPAHHPQEPEDWPQLWVAIGRETLGRVYQTRAGFGAFQDDGAFLGSFSSIALARSAIWSAHIIAAEVGGLVVDIDDHRHQHERRAA